MSDGEAIRGGRESSQIEGIDTHEQIVRDYLMSLEAPPEQKSFDPGEVTKGIDDPIAKLKALSAAKRRSDVNELEEQFIDVAPRWAAKNDIGRESFAQLGVPQSVLKRAFAGGAPRHRSGGRTRVSIEALAAGIEDKPSGTILTVAAISGEFGGSPATVRKVLEQLAKNRVVVNQGPDANYRGRGRAPLIFRRV